MKVCLKISIPSYRHVLSNDQLGVGHYVYEMEVVSNRFTVDVDQGVMNNGTKALPVGQAKVFRLDKRYSQFLALHSELRKSYLTPEFPPKRVINTSPRLLEQRRRALEVYMRKVCTLTPTPTALVSFFELNINRSQQIPKDTCRKRTSRTTHQPVIQFRQVNPFLEVKTCCRTHCQTCKGDHVLPDLVTQATLRLFYPENKP